MLSQHPHNAELFCFVVGRRRDGGGGCWGAQINYKLNIFHLDSIYSTFGPVHKYPDIFLKGDSISLLPLKRQSARKRRFGHHEKQVFENGP